MTGSKTMIGWDKIKPKKPRKSKAAAKDAAADKPAPPRLPDDDLYESGDICAPERDRDDEQRDL
ncbi:hypothetical protein IP86_16140 [Rhodopseudomonas sp. AAP120]|uniref:hypothetical protein n=1 Tax=Rhodopseudomonas sp. AAP120 TaxID=1523430 RepID=UPI0006B925FE|nr:hypothetical protein [Rhodopseudomonas sp. AAP120]KPF96555.1 hypothetical protein IP86_16140 [Rhodopseudomonas sp. AAP120]